MDICWNSLKDQSKEREEKQALKSIKGKYGNLQRPVQDKAGSTLMTKEGQLNRWEEHYEELLNRPLTTKPNR